MSRSGYSDDYDDLDGMLAFGRWRAIIASASRGKRGQAFLRSLLDALDAMPVKELARDDMVDDSGCMCALAVLDKHRGGDPARLDPYDHESLGREFNIAHQLSQEVMFINDESYPWNDKAKRWQEVRDWAAKQIIAA